MDLKKAQEYIKALKNGEKFPKKNMFLIMFLLGALLFVIVLPTGSSVPISVSVPVTSLYGIVYL